ncbi:hypothetical protein CRG98_000763 [Punica granatum]|uniref:Uncharacterized protein n=1 Tax=Punica granatum TaxID=22663 RepID=A0A2I0LDU5_PUNGR|nr:hypothetical protein CRG98_000763 [Punica granatum]
MDVEEVWTCMGMHACKPKGRWSTVGGHTDALARRRNERRARVHELALGWHYSPESDDFARNALIDLKQ